MTKPREFIVERNLCGVCDAPLRGGEWEFCGGCFAEAVNGAALDALARATEINQQSIGGNADGK